MWTYVLIVVLCHGFVKGAITLSKFKFLDKCSFRLPESVGELEFDADDIRPFRSDYRCTVYITPSKRDSQIMFYFEEFGLSSSCEDTNLTITQGDYNVRTTVPGLPNYMCGENRTLLKTDQNFITSKGTLIIIYSCSQKGRRYPGSFRLKFLEFYIGKCYGKDERECSDGRCVKSRYHCSDKIRACPLEDRDCSSLADPIGVQITHIVKNVGWIALAAIVFYLLRYLYRSNNSCICAFINRICRRTRRNSHDDDAARPSLETETEPVPSLSRTSEPEQTELSTSRHSLNSDGRISLELIGVTSSDDDTSPFAQPNHSTPADPPPSYDDVVVPSYDEVIANEHRYTPFVPSE